MTRRIVLVGAGHAAIECAASLRRLGHSGALLVLGDESQAPYERPSLSKTVLAGRDAPALRGDAFFSGRAIELRRSCRAVAIDRDGGAVQCADGSRIAYDRLVLATGAAARRLPAAIVGDDVEPLVVRRLDDALRLRAALPCRLLVIGGGYLGLEVAAAARQRGADVTVLEAADQLLARVAPRPIGDAVASLHAARGTRCMRNARLVSLVRDGAQVCATLADGSVLCADQVVAAIGAVPASELAEVAGLAVEDGVLVDADGRSSDPNIFAIGDVARRDGETRVEALSVAVAQARRAAAALLGAAPPAAEIPWFWSDQYDARLQSVGLGGAGDEAVVLPDGRALTVLQFRGDRLRAVHALDSPSSFLAGKRLVAAEASRDQALAALAPARARVVIPPF